MFGKNILRIKAIMPLTIRTCMKQLFEKKPVRERIEHGYNTIKLIELANESHQKQCTIACTGLLPVSIDSRRFDFAQRLEADLRSFDCAQDAQDLFKLQWRANYLHTMNAI